MNIHMTYNAPFALESPLHIVEGEEFRLTCIWMPGTNITAASVKVYRNSTDVTSTCTSGSTTYSENTVVTPTIKNLSGNSKYIVAVLFTSGSKYIRKIQLNVQKDEKKQ